MLRLKVGGPVSPPIPLLSSTLRSSQPLVPFPNSINIILELILPFSNSIPSSPLDGKSICFTSEYRNQVSQHRYFNIHTYTYNSPLSTPINYSHIHGCSFCASSDSNAILLLVICALPCRLVISAALALLDIFSTSTSDHILHLTNIR